ncbi:MAG: HPF/RaiA family ribosome-associated protein [Gemmataceae bacterium]
MHVEIRRQGLELFPRHKHFLTDKVHNVLRNFQNHVHRVSAFLSDINGPKGGINKRCRMLVHLKSEGTVVVQHTGESITSAIGGALDRLGQAIRRKLFRKRTESRQKSRRLDPSVEGEMA